MEITELRTADIATLSLPGKLDNTNSVSRPQRRSRWNFPKTWISSLEE